MKAQHVSLENTGQFSKLFLDYIHQQPSLTSFYKYVPDISSFQKIIQDISVQSLNRKLLVEVLSEQYHQTGIAPPASLPFLAQKNTFTVCTGHQLCLFTGPLYFIYKIITTINLAETLKKSYPENNFIPVFWMASEDHDFEEVNHVNVFGKKLKWNNKQGGVMGSYLNNGIDKIIDELRPILGESEFASELILLLQNAYQKQKDFASATRYLVHELFGKYGLVIIDGNNARLKNEFVGIMEDDLFNNSGYKAVGKSIVELEKLGYKAQVNPREINLFYIYDNQRNRIVYENDKFNVLGLNKSFTEVELKKEINLQPERFSPNVVLRPVYQQKILPNLAYIGGPGELAYWLEFRQLFDLYKVTYPAFIPRNFVMLADAPVVQKLNKLGFVLDDVFLPVSKQVEKYISSISGEKISLDSEKLELEALYNNIIEKVSLVDPSLIPSAKSELQKSTNTFNELEKKLLKSFKHKNETAVSQIEKIHAKLFPENILQERYDNFIPYYLKTGVIFLDELKAILNPFDKRMIILSEFN